MNHSDLVAAYLKSEKSAQPFYARLRALSARESERAHLFRSYRAARPGASREEIDAWIDAGRPSLRRAA